MRENQRQLIIGPKGQPIPCPPGSVAQTDPRWEKIALKRWREEEAARLSRKEEQIFKEVKNIFLRNFFDLGGGGLGHKLGMACLLLQQQGNDQQFLELCRRFPLGESNFYISSLVQHPAREIKEDFIVPPWFYHHFEDNERLKKLYQTTGEISKRAPGEQELESLSFLAYQDLYCFYELAVLVIEFLNAERPGTIRADDRPQDHLRQRKRVWQQSAVLAGLRDIFHWPRKGQPNLGELLEASRLTLIEYQEQLGFSEEISPLPSLD